MGLLIEKIRRAADWCRGASMIELSVSLLVMSTLTTGFVGAVAVGAIASEEIGQRDSSLIIARSQAEYIASLPTDGTYPVYPSAPEDYRISVFTGDVGCPGGGFLQCLRIEVLNEARGTGDTGDIITLQAYRAVRFIVADPATNGRVVPPSGGLERAHSVAVPIIPPGEGYAVVINPVFHPSVPRTSPRNGTSISFPATTMTTTMMTMIQGLSLSSRRPVWRHDGGD